VQRSRVSLEWRTCMATTGARQVYCT